MARLSRKAQLLVRWWGELRVRELIKELRIACATCTYTELRPVVYPSAEQREALFRLGVDVKQVDGGFPSRAELAAFISNARAQVQAFQASLGPDQPREVADGLLCEVLQTWSPPGDKWTMLYEQEYEIRYGGEGCETPPDVLRELCDLFGITGAELQRMDNLQAEDLLYELKKRPENSRRAILARRQALHLAWSRDVPEVKKRIKEAKARQIASVVSMVVYASQP